VKKSAAGISRSPAGPPAIRTASSARATAGRSPAGSACETGSRVRAELLGRGGAPASAEAAARVTLPLESLALGAPAGRRLDAVAADSGTKAAARPANLCQASWTLP